MVASGSACLNYSVQLLTGQPQDTCMFMLHCAIFLQYDALRIAELRR
jgi:hypothetical protein